MRAPRFCSECGEKLIAQSRRLRRRAFCKMCAPALWRPRFISIAALALLTAISFAIGRYTAPREPFYFIGTPLDLKADPARLAENSSQSSTAGQAAAPASAERVDTGSALCGARTKSGGACRRRVRGGGYCFQHRDKPNPGGFK
jgi:hypothetical protein